MANTSFHFSRTTSMAVSTKKKRPLHLPHKGPLYQHGGVGGAATGPGRRYTAVVHVHPRRRDSVLSDGSSDRSSSQSDDAFHIIPAFPECSPLHNGIR